MLGYVLATKDCLEVRDDDMVLYEEGAPEVLKTASGELLHWLHESAVTAVDDDIWPKPQAEKTLTSGLILPGSF